MIARDKANYRVHLDLTVTYRGFTTREELDTIVRVKTNVCGKCSKITGQLLRGDPADTHPGP